MWPSLARNLFFPVQERLKGHRTFACLSELEKSASYSSTQLEQLQFEKFKALINHAYQNVPYYQKLFKRARFSPSDIKSLQDAERIPFLTKDDIRKNLRDLQARTAHSLVKLTTGGSAGEPLIFYVDKRRISYDIAAAIRAKRWWGIDIGMREVVFWGSHVEIDRQHYIREIRDKLLNTKLLSAFNLDPPTMLQYARFIQHYRPVYLFGYPSSIALFCKFAQTQKLDLTQIGVKAIFVTAEVLSPTHKDIIETAFHCPTANGYGGRDGGFIAHECPHGGMHITADNVFLEFVKHGQRVTEGQVGEIVVTHLDAYAMPFIRYKIGDVGSYSGRLCPCGRALPLMEVIEGRVTDFIVTPSGRIMHALALIYVMRAIEGVEQFKIIQRSPYSLLIKVVWAQNGDRGSCEQIKKTIRELFKADIEVAIESVITIAPESSGKFRYVVSQVANPYL